MTNQLKTHQINSKASIQNLVTLCNTQNQKLTTHSYQWEQGQDYSVNDWPEEMVIRVNAGMTIGDLNEKLKKSNQFLPIDAPENTTISQIIDHQIYGPLRSTYGTARDQLLGLALIDGQSRDIRVGGQTVKNVAGYDITRLVLGAKGSLGIIYEATFKTVVIPIATQYVKFKTSNINQLISDHTQWYVTDAKPNWCLLTREEKQGGGGVCISDT